MNQTTDRKISLATRGRPKLLASSATTSSATTSVATAGFAMLELIVAAGLLATAVGLVATCAVAGQRVQRLQLQHTLAVDELSNQLERLTARSPDEIESVLKQLQPSDWAVQRLPGATFSGERLDDQWGNRIELRFQWTRAGNPPPLIAVAWLQGESKNPSEPNETNGANESTLKDES